MGKLMRKGIDSVHACWTGMDEWIVYFPDQAVVLEACPIDSQGEKTGPCMKPTSASDPTDPSDSTDPSKIKPRRRQSKLVNEIRRSRGQTRAPTTSTYPQILTDVSDPSDPSDLAEPSNIKPRRRESKHDKDRRRSRGETKAPTTSSYPLGGTWLPTLYPPQLHTDVS